MKRILVVDDDDFCRNFVTGALQRSGFEVVEARDGKEGLRLFREGTFDLVILDLFMPGMNGVEALIQFDPRHSGIPVIVVSGGNFPGASEPSKLSDALGAARFLPKPFAVEALVALIEDLTRAGRLPPPVPAPER